MKIGKAIENWVMQTPDGYNPNNCDHFRSRKAFTVAVEGNIGSGKTTFLNRFCPETDNVDVLAEPVDRDDMFIISIIQSY